VAYAALMKYTLFFAGMSIQLIKCEEVMTNEGIRNGIANGKLKMLSINELSASISALLKQILEVWPDIEKDKPYEPSK